MGGETESNVSSWTVDSLHEHLSTVVAQVERRQDDHFVAQEKAVDAALAAAEKAVDAARGSAEKAVNAALAAVEKANDRAIETANKRFDSVNEFRQTLTDQAATFATRVEVEAKLKGIDDKIDGFGRGLDRIEGRSAGVNAGWLYLVQFASLAGAAIAIVLALTGR